MITLSNASDKPIYEQITEQFKHLIIQGQLIPGAALPSIRGLAKELKISAMTTKRAYEDLERDGFIETVAGKGSFVAKRNQDFLREALITEVEKHLLKAIKTAKTANISTVELTQLLQLLMEEHNV
ncbi:MAG: GntR family transcriptional regulator [Lysinibacillus sp.]